MVELALPVRDPVEARSHDTDLPNNGHAVGTRSRTQRHIDYDQQVKGVRNEFTHLCLQSSRAHSTRLDVKRSTKGAERRKTANIWTRPDL